MKQNACRFAADGYFCVADLFYRSGETLSFDFARMAEEGYREWPRRIVASINPDAVIADTEAVLDAIADDPAASSGLKVCVGYCMGGGASPVGR